MTDDLSKEERDEAFRTLFSFLTAVLKQNPERGIVGKMDCPICGGNGSVTYTRSTYNGHLHAGCSACSIGVME